ncbi:MAG: FHA domain-containing protein [Spirochaetales bacterium]|nr:FHA domain-containing protein [Spirochaetales bacterium]
MSLGMRIVFFAVIGVFAGVLAWPFVELVLFFQASLLNLLLFSVVTGMTVGIFMAGFFGSSEGIITKSFQKIRMGVLFGVILGIIGGGVGTIAGQAFVLFLGTFFFNSGTLYKYIGLPLSRALGWACLGLFVGSVEGIRTRSFAKIRNGLIGGFLGGIIGGLLFEYLKFLFPESIFSRLVGLSFLGLLIGIFYALVENKMARATLYLLNGKDRGKEFLLTQRKTDIGDSPKTAVNLDGYKDMEPVHTVIERKKDGYVLTDAGGTTKTLVNDDVVKTRALEDGDVIRVGEAQFLFKKK